MKSRLLMIVAAVLMVVGCSKEVKNARMVDALPPIFPDYAGVTIPVGIAPLNFNSSTDADRIDVVVTGSKGGSMHVQGDYADFDIDEWHGMLEQNRGGSLSLTVSIMSGGSWSTYRPFRIYVSTDNLPDYGLTYRRIAPGYETYSKMGIYERELATFNERPIVENTLVAGMCVNCHTSNRTNPDLITFHIRGNHGATMIQRNGRREWLKAQNDSIHGSMVYPYWHPSGKYCAYSTNMTRQGFHETRQERIEVFDHSSDVFVYSLDTHELILDTLLMTKDHYETDPVFSPDGKTLYFCSSTAEPIPDSYKKIRYNICKIAFDPQTGTFGNRVDTIFNARQMGKSATHPRPSYDGRYIMFTMSDYGCFPIWHKEADNWLLNLATGKAAPLTAANSTHTDSWHNWSAGSRWFVFTSRRGDGLYTRLYLASVDNRGNATKPFLLPQRNPKEYYSRLLDSYNTPDFTSKPVDFNARKAGREISSDKRIDTQVKM